MSIEMNQIHEDLKKLNELVTRIELLLAKLVDNTGIIAERSKYR